MYNDEEYIENIELDIKPINLEDFEVTLTDLEDVDTTGTLTPVVNDTFIKEYNNLTPEEKKEHRRKQQKEVLEIGIKLFENNLKCYPKSIENMKKVYNNTPDTKFKKQIYDMIQKEENIIKSSKRNLIIYKNKLRELD